uniref:G protein-coupled receptor 63 n=1 Tax=Sinocyclocheilus grahami TaxID=75366 RepID=A0A672RMD8_SINGR
MENSSAKLNSSLEAAMRSAINILLASLAFADMMLAVLNMPFALVTMLTTCWIFGEAFCRMSAMFFWMFLMEGVAILMIISVDRFLIILQKQDKLTILPCTFPPRAPQCVFGYTVECGYHAYVMLIMLMFFFVPFLVMLFTFMGILSTLRHNVLRIHSHPDSVCLNQASKLGLMSLQRPFQMNVDMSFKTRAFTMILILFSVFTACWAPFATYSLLSTFSQNFFEISTWLLWTCYLKSALNPLIYYWRIKKFRDACLLPGHTKRRIRPSAVYVCGEHRSVV